MNTNRPPRAIIRELHALAAALDTVARDNGYRGPLADTAREASLAARSLGSDLDDAIGTPRYVGFCSSAVRRVDALEADLDALVAASLITDEVIDDADAVLDEVRAMAHDALRFERRNARRYARR